MIEFREENDSLSEAEALVRAAGGYVEASADLRPRVLEVARTQQRELRARRRIGRAACAVLAAAILTGVAGQRVESLATYPADSLLAARSDDLFAMAQAKVACGGSDLGWSMVEVFTEMRRQQAESLRPPN